MNKIMFSGFMASIVAASSTAMADGVASSLTTKNYVDSGLRAVYSTASSASTKADNALSQLETISGTLGGTDSGLVSDVVDLQATVGNASSGLVRDVDALESAVGDNTRGLVYRVNMLEATSHEYTAGNGVTINSNDGVNTVGIKGMTAATETDGKMYVFKNGSLSEMPVEDTWDDSILQ